LTYINYLFVGGSETTLVLKRDRDYDCLTHKKFHIHANQRSVSVNAFVKSRFTGDSSVVECFAVSLGDKFHYGHLSTNFALRVKYSHQIPNYSQHDATFLDLFIFRDALHVSGGFSAHHQEHITVHTASGIVNQYCC
jgi:hypothetical protein